MEITLVDLERIKRILEVPLYAFGLNLLIEKTSMEEWQLKGLYSEIEISNDFLNELSDINKITTIFKVFSTSIEIINQNDDISTLTGFSENEIYETRNKLLNIITPR